MNFPKTIIFHERNKRFLSQWINNALESWVWVFFQSTWEYVTCMRAYVHNVCSSKRGNDAFRSHLNRFRSLTLMPVMKIMMMMVVLRHKVLVFMWETFVGRTLKYAIENVMCHATPLKIGSLELDTYIHFNRACRVSTIRNKFAFQSKTPKLNHHDLIQWKWKIWFFDFRNGIGDSHIPRCFPQTLLLANV